MKLSKLDIARRQLLTAIDLFFSDGDPVSIHTLAGACHEILDKLCQLSGIDPFTSDAKDAFPDLEPKDIRRAFNLFKNAFKHADREDSDVIDLFDEVQNDSLIFVACFDYSRLRQIAPIQMHLFMMWYHAVHGADINSPFSPGFFSGIFPGMQEASRSERKAIGKRALGSPEKCVRIIGASAIEQLDGDGAE